MSINWNITVIFDLIIVLVIVVATIIIGKVSEKIFKGAARKAGVPEGEAILVGSLLKYLIYFIGFVEILTHIGISSIPILFATAIVGLILGISARSTLENVISGYVLRMRKPFSIGEQVKIRNKIGVIKDLDLVYTTIETNNHEDYIIPNSQITNSKILNLSRSKYKFSTEIFFQTSLDTSISKMKELILKSLENLFGINPDLPIMISGKSLKINMITFEINFYVLEYEMINRARDFLIEQITKGIKNDFQINLKNHLEEKSPKISITHNIQNECSMCDSSKWTGFLRCKKTSRYYLYGKCLDCDHLRFEKCPIEGSELEFIPYQKKNKMGEKLNEP